MMADSALRGLTADFDQMYARTGRPSIPPEQLLRALLVQLLYSVRSERMLVEQLEYNLLFRWFVGLPLSERAWDATTFTKNRDRLLSGEIAQRFFSAVVREAKRHRLLHDEQFTVDGTLIDGFEKSYREKPDPPSRGTGSKGEMLKSDLYESVTDPDARMYRKGLKTGWKLRHMAHAVSENEHGLVVATSVSTCSPRAERQAAIAMMRRLRGSFRRARCARRQGVIHEQEFVRADAADGRSRHSAGNPRNAIRHPSRPLRWRSIRTTHTPAAAVSPGRTD